MDDGSTSTYNYSDLDYYDDVYSALENVSTESYSSTREGPEQTICLFHNHIIIIIEEVFTKPS